MNPYQTIIRPLITEKNTFLMEQNKYSFEVANAASKDDVRSAIETIFNVSVMSVRTINVRGKLKRRGREFGYQKNWKKAIVTLAPGDQIELFEG